MQVEMKNEKTNGISKVARQENFRITCVERKYKVSNSKIEFVVIAKKELDENITRELLFEDMELKTFLEKYEIAEILPVAVRKESFNTVGKNLPERKSTADRIKKSRTVIEAMKRRGLFDSLNLTETFSIKDYKKALEDNGIKVTNTAMPYDDLNWFEKQGNIVRIGKGEHGAVSFTKKIK